MPRYHATTMPRPGMVERARMPVARLSQAVWLMLGAMTAAVVISFALLGLSVALSSNRSLLAIVGGYTALVVFYKTLRRDPTIAEPLEAVGQLFLVIMCGALLTNAASAIGLPYRDAELQAIDQAMGFSRSAYRNVIYAVQGLPDLLDTAYLSIQLQTLAIPFALIICRQLARLRLFVLALGITLIITSCIAAVVPAISAAIYIDLAPLREAGIPAGFYTHVPTLQALRSGAMTMVPLNNLEGLVTFPSVHTANAILFAWALWRVRVLRWPGVILNGLMIASTPLTGSHYVIDLVGGAVVAGIAIASARAIGRACGVSAASGHAVPGRSSDAFAEAA